MGRPGWWPAEALRWTPGPGELPAGAGGIQTRAWFQARARVVHGGSAAKASRSVSARFLLTPEGRSLKSPIRGDRISNLRDLVLPK